MNNDTSSLRETLYTPSFKWLIRLVTPLYFASVLVAYSALSPIEVITEHFMLIGILFFWAEFDILKPIHEWLTNNYEFVFKVTRKDQTEYFNSYQFSARRNAAHRPILHSYPIGHYVYVIKDASASGYYKIGRTIEPSSRLRKFGVMLPFEIHVIAIISCEDEMLLEASLHKQFASKRVNGEWYALNGDDIQHIVTNYGLKFY